MDIEDKGTDLKPDRTRGMEVFVDADFHATWNLKDTANIYGIVEV